MIRALRIGAAIFVAVRRNVNFAADNRLHVVRGSLMEEICRREEVSVISDGDRRHFLPRRLGGQLADFASAIEQRIIRVHMQVYELGRTHLFFYLSPVLLISLRLPREKEIRFDPPPANFSAMIFSLYPKLSRNFFACSRRAVSAAAALLSVPPLHAQLSRAFLQPAQSLSRVPALRCDLLSALPSLCRAFSFFLLSASEDP